MVDVEEKYDDEVLPVFASQILKQICTISIDVYVHKVAKQDLQISVIRVSRTRNILSMENQCR